MGLEVATIFTVLLSHTSRGLVLTVACKLAVKVFGRLQWWLGGDSRLLLASSGAQSCWYPALDFDSGLETHLSCCVARSPVYTHVQPSRVTEATSGRLLSDPARGLPGPLSLCRDPRMA